MNHPPAINDYVSDSLLSVFKIGPGPSSSHTIAPMLAAGDYRRRYYGSNEYTITLFGSLALTGRGHGSDRAIIAGLCGEEPESCDIATFNSRQPGADNCYVATGLKIKFIYDCTPHPYPYQNTMLIAASDAPPEIYYSIGGGEVIRASAAPKTPVELPHQYINMRSFIELATRTGLSTAEIIRANEAALHPKKDIDAELDRRIDLMCAAVERGLATDGFLPGELRVKRRAKEIYQCARNNPNPLNQLLLTDAFAIAAAEENAAGSLVVTAPTSGASGLLPGIIYHLRQTGFSREQLRLGIFHAGLIALLAKSNGSISGAEVGCQGEIGIAAAMAAAMLAALNGGSLKTVECAAEIALEHHLGLSCDPIGGYVQIPCIERNAISAITAVNAALLAAAGAENSSLVGFDDALHAMVETGRAMPCAYKETSLGGLATCACRNNR